MDTHSLDRASRSVDCEPLLRRSGLKLLSARLVGVQMRGRAAKLRTTTRLWSDTASATARSEARHRLANYSSRGPSISPKSLAIQDLSVLNSNPTATRCTRPTHTQRAADSRDGRSMRRQADLDLRAIASTGPSAHHVLDRDGTLLRMLVLLWRNDRRFGLSLVSTSSSQARIASQRPSRPQWSDRCRDA